MSYALVFNMATQETITYTCLPAQAVIAAYEQFERKNYNTWTYPTPENHPEFKTGKHHYFCGNFGVKKENPTP